MKMMENNITIDNRRDKRIELPRSIVLNPKNVCMLKNLSRGGLSFKSLKGVLWPAKWNLDILTYNRDFDIEQCPVELVWMKTEDELVGSSALQVNVGVRFGGLDEIQKEKLDTLLAQSQ